MARPNKTRTRELYLAIEANLRRVEATTLEVMRHPEATPELMWSAHTTYMHIWRSVVDTRELLRTRYPDVSVFMPDPWNRPLR